MMVITDGNVVPFLAGRPVSIIIIIMIVGALYFALRPKKWETAEKELNVPQTDERGDS